MIFALGQFEGRGGHTLRGGFRFETGGAGGKLFATSDDFFFDGSPAPGFGLTTAEPLANLTQLQEAAIETDFFRLEGSGNLFGEQTAIYGVQTRNLKPEFTLEGFSYVFLWCYQTPFLLGVGEIRTPER